MSEISERLKNKRSIGIISCSGCPAAQKKGGSTGIENWKMSVADLVEVAWTLITPIICDKRLLRLHMDEMASRLQEVDAILVLVCKYGEKILQDTFGYSTISCLETLDFGVINEHGTFEKLGKICEYD